MGKIIREIDTNPEAQARKQQAERQAKEAETSPEFLRKKATMEAVTKKTAQPKPAAAAK